MPTLQDLQAQDTAFNKQSADQQAAAKQQEEQAKQPPSFLQTWTAPVVRAGTAALDSAVHAADTFFSAADDKEGGVATAASRVARSATAGVITGAVNTADAVHSGIESGARRLSVATGGDPNEPDPVGPWWDHAKKAILDYRDAMAVKDPNGVDSTLQAVTQLAVPFAGYSRALSFLHGTANMLAAGAVTDATALGPHDMRMADLISLGKHTENKLGAALNTIAPDGTLFTAYINYLADRTNESEAAGRLKNVLDGAGVNLVAAPLLHGVMSTLKYGQAGLRFAADNGIGGIMDLAGERMGNMTMPGSMKSQEGKIGFHGTPHDPDFFDNSKIGTGEGAQLYGYGHYIAENPETAQHYANTLSANGTASAALKLARSTLAASDSPREAVQKLQAMADKAEHPNDKAHYQTAAGLVKAGNAVRGSGNVLKVHVDDEHIANMGDWDKPFSEQPKILAKLQAAGYDPLKNLTGQRRDPSEVTLGEFYKTHAKAGFAPYLSQDMADAGVPGIKYLDAGSRSTPGEGTRNFVVFDGKHIKILAKNGKPVEK